MRYVKQLARYLAYRWVLRAWLFVMVTLIWGVSFQRSLRQFVAKQASEDPGSGETLPSWRSLTSAGGWVDGERVGGEVRFMVACLAGLTWGQGFME